MTEKEIVTYYIGADGLKYATPEMANELIKRQQQRLLSGAGIPTQDSLKSYPHDNEAESVAKLHQQMNAAGRKRHLDYVKAMMDDNAVWKDASGDAKRNRELLKPSGGVHGSAEKMKKINPKVKAMFDGQDNLSDEFKQAATEVFEQAIASKRLSECLSEMCREDPILSLAFADQGTVDICDALAWKIEELEAECAKWEEANQELREARMVSQMGLAEEVLYNNPPSRSSRRRVSLNDNFSENDDAEFMGEDNKQYIDPKMKSYSDAIKRTTSY